MNHRIVLGQQRSGGGVAAPAVRRGSAGGADLRGVAAHGDGHIAGALHVDGAVGALDGHGAACGGAPECTAVSTVWAA